MTALTSYQRLEAPGLWREARGAQRRDVYVSLGDATLSILDGSERPLAHWSLPAIERTNPGTLPALYTPGPDAGEELELSDETMIDALATLTAAIDRRRPRRGRLRGAVLWTALLAAVLSAVLWLPGALVRHAVSVVPLAARAETGQRLLAAMADYTGPPCRADAARPALDRLTERLLGRGGGQIVVVRGGIETAEHLPGRIFVVGHSLLERYDGPEQVAGYVTAERLRARDTDPLARMLHATGPFAALQLLTRGAVPQSAIDAYALHLLQPDPLPLDPQTLTAGFAEAGIDPAPWLAASPGAATTTPRADPATLRPILDDGAWVALQGICGR
ncbi:hypothetical protein OCGS_1154 [Oceaniovalibus guishaninsula JLT2003]|uniref:Uncharacterized protein n=1 Tax=Oceaniovalibus guishaninsula JLT2003 TaxID=1231392 RepID=K2GQ32_9RHOB|nr:hypothetical protein [Oceaniovalibus guishaninsula]EKE44771.1 hypothetical protein OCGS_1154 [Oceaniovalibus guishaninsula JLT2003]